MGRCGTALAGRAPSLMNLGTRKRAGPQAGSPGEPHRFWWGFRECPQGSSNPCRHPGHAGSSELAGGTDGLSCWVVGLSQCDRPEPAEAGDAARHLRRRRVTGGRSGPACPQPGEGGAGGPLLCPPATPGGAELLGPGLAQPLRLAARASTSPLLPAPGTTLKPVCGNRLGLRTGIGRNGRRSEPRRPQVRRSEDT